MFRPEQDCLSSSLQLISDTLVQTKLVLSTGEALIEASLFPDRDAPIFVSKITTNAEDNPDYVPSQEEIKVFAEFIHAKYRDVIKHKGDALKLPPSQVGRTQDPID